MGNKLIVGVNDLKSVNPELAAEWNYEKNGKLLPEMISANSNKKVWWKCKNGHEWQVTPNHRTRGDGCPYCSGHRVLKGFNDLQTLNPTLASEWHPTKNGSLKPTDVTLGNDKKVWWLGKCGHEWYMRINHRTIRGRGCPFCSNKQILIGYNDLITTNPELAGEWHPTQNGNLKPIDVSSGSNRKVWWLGKCGHEWESRVNHRRDGVGCPYCAGQKVLKGFNDLATTNPELAAEWHPTKNSDLAPTDVISGSNRKVCY